MRAIGKACGANRERRDSVADVLNRRPGNPLRAVHVDPKSPGSVVGKVYRHAILRICVAAGHLESVFVDYDRVIHYTWRKPRRQRSKS